MAFAPWGFPGAFWFAVVAVPVIAAFFFRYRSRVQEVPAISHWLQIGRPTDVRSAGALLRRLLSLLVQLLLIALLVFCLADPFPKPPSVRRVAIVIDVSATMQTKETGGTRLTLALTEARNVLANVEPDAQVYVVTAADHPASLRPAGIDPKTALALLDSVRPCDTDADLPAAIRAVSFLAADPSARVVIISDFAGTSTPSALSSFWNGSAPLTFTPVGADHPDAAITAAWSRPESHGWRVGATFSSRGLAGKHAMAHVTANGHSLADGEIVLKDGTTNAEFLVDLPPGTPYQIGIDTGDALSVDDWVVGVLPARRTSICLITRGNPALERALRADSAVALRVVRHDLYDGSGDSTVVIVDGPGLTSLSPRTARGYLFIGTPDPFGFVELNAPAKISDVTHWRGDHPAFAELDPSSIHFRAAMAVESTSSVGLIPLLSSADTPLIGELPSNAADVMRPKMIYWLFQVSDTDLASRLSFPVLLWNTVDYLAGQEDEPPTHLTGHPLTLESPMPPVVTGPDGSNIEVGSIGSRFRVLNTTIQGVYHVHTERGDEAIAVDLLSARGTLPLPRDDYATTSPTTGSIAQSGGMLNWRLLLGAAVALAIVEGLLFHFRVVRIG